MKIILLGDIMLGRLFNQTVQLPFSKPVIDILKTSDLVVGNLETAITDSDSPVPKTFNYKMLPHHVKWLQQAHIDHVNIANNHILDYGVEGLFDTQSYLDQAGISWVGAGKNLAEATEMMIYTVDGKKVGLIGASDHYKEWQATTRKPGIFYFDMKHPELLLGVVKDAAQKVDILVVSLHWGPNYTTGAKVPPEMKRLGRGLVDAGAKIIHGTSAHHILPVEVYKNSLIIYSNGDFIDDYAIDPIYRNDIGMMVIVEIDRNLEIKYKIQPTIIKNMKVGLLTV